MLCSFVTVRCLLELGLKWADVVLETAAQTQGCWRDPQSLLLITPESEVWV